MALPTNDLEPLPYEPGNGGSASPTTARAIAARLSAGTKTISAVRARDAANNLQTIKEGWVRTLAGLKQVFGALAANLSTTTVSGARNNSGTVLVTSGSVTASGAGGSPPYNYAWTRTDGGGHSWTITDPTLATTKFKTNVAHGASEVATFICTITDALGNTAVSDPVTATCGNG